MKILKKIKNNNSTQYNFLGLPLYKKEKFISSKSYYLFGVLFYKKKIKSDGYEIHLFNKKIYSKKYNVVKKIRPYAKNKDFIYFCFHSGDFYYLCSLIKNNFDKFKDTVIITNFGYAKLVFEMLDFDADWVETHFVVVPNLWLWSLGLWCKADGTIISKVQLDHETGWIVNNKKQKRKEYLTIAETIKNFLQEKDFKHVTQITNCNKQNLILLIPESQFNGELNINILESLIKSLTQKGYQIAINTKSNKYDNYLNDDVTKVFMNYKETLNFASSCKAIISVRNGLMDCLQSVASNKVKVFCVYTKWRYPQYKFFKDFDKWFKAVYSFNKINNTSIFFEYSDFNFDTTTEIIKELNKNGG